MKLCISVLGFFNKYCCWPRLSQSQRSITENSLAGKSVPVTVIWVSGEYSVFVLYGSLSVPLELSRSGFSTLRGSFATLTLFWRM